MFANHTSPILARGLVELAEVSALPESIYAGLRDALDDEGDEWLAPDLEESFWRRAADAPVARDFPAIAPAQSPKGTFGAIELAATTAPDVRHALRAFTRASDVLHGVPVFDLAEREDGSAALIYRSPHGRGSAEGAMAAELALTSAVELVRRGSGEPAASPDRAFMVGEPHGRARTLSRALGCGLHPDAALDRLELSAELLALPLCSPDRRMHRLALRMIELERRRAAGAWTATAARGALRHVVLGEAPPIPELARTLRLSPHTLRARLKDESVKARVLIDDARRATVDRLLVAGAKPSEVQRTLGYADLASLRRACRRWWGMGPLARRALLDRIPPRRIRD